SRSIPQIRRTVVEKAARLNVAVTVSISVSYRRHAMHSTHTLRRLPTHNAPNHRPPVPKSRRCAQTRNLLQWTAVLDSFWVFEKMAKAFPPSWACCGVPRRFVRAEKIRELSSATKRLE